MTTEMKGMVQYPAHSLAAEWHCHWGHEQGIIYSSGLFSTSPIFIREKETSLSQKKVNEKSENIKNQELNIFWGTGAQGKLYHGIFFFRRNIPLFQAKAVGNFHLAWFGPWH